MTSEQAWGIFEQTGNVEAYLLYLQLKSEEKGETNEPGKTTPDAPQC